MSHFSGNPTNQDLVLNLCYSFRDGTQEAESNWEHDAIVGARSAPYEESIGKGNELELQTGDEIRIRCVGNDSICEPDRRAE
jgi:hypothetical protein